MAFRIRKTGYYDSPLCPSFFPRLHYQTRPHRHGCFRPSTKYAAAREPVQVLKGDKMKKSLLPFCHFRHSCLRGKHGGSTHLLAASKTANSKAFAQLEVFTYENDQNYSKLDLWFRGQSFSLYRHRSFAPALSSRQRICG